MSQNQYDIAEFIVKNKVVIVHDLTPAIQKHLSQLETIPTDHFEDRFIKLVIGAIVSKVSEEMPFTLDAVNAIVDLDFITSISGEYFFTPEKYEYRNQN